jgi:hypothetical protein
MTDDFWRDVLVWALALNAVMGLAYRTYRLTKGGPMSDVIGQAILSCVLALVAVGVATGAAAAHWGALAYGLLFGVVVMPVWVLAVLIPLRPGAIDYSFTALYWMGCLAIVVGAIAL